MPSVNYTPRSTSTRTRRRRTDTRARTRSVATGDLPRRIKHLRDKLALLDCFQQDTESQLLNLEWLVFCHRQRALNYQA